MANPLAGLGDISSQFRVYIGNRPDFADLKVMSSVRPAQRGEIKDIGDRCGNGWRKVFNVYAKLVFALKEPKHLTEQFDNWQAWRDQSLLAQKSHTLLLFSPPDISTDFDGIQIVMGRTWAKQWIDESEVNWLNEEFAVALRRKLIICPYFDYRQLSNQKIIRLCDLIHSL